MEFLNYYVDIIVNVSLLFSLGSIYILLPFRNKDNSIRIKIIAGVLIGLIGLVVMNAQFHVTEGFILDTRSVLLSVSAAFFGFIPGMIAAIITSALRISQGGAGTLTGIIVIFATMFSGLVFRKYRIKHLDLHKIRTILELYAFGLVTHLIMLVCFYTLPFDTANFVLGIIVVPVLITFPLITIPLGLILLIQKQNLANKDKLEQISKLDFLTNLYNRYYFDIVVDSIDENQFYPIGVIMGDVNGLKLINDSYGHLKGDELLINISNILLNNVRKDDYLFRWGGDEFVIISLKSNISYLLKVIEQIKIDCEKTKFSGIQPSISLGYSLQSAESENINDLLKNAEEIMYHNKLSESKSVYSHFISLLENTLIERKYETEQHSKNIAQFSIELARKMELSSNDIQNLELVARLHDIGKIGINEEILLKKGKLTKIEYEEIKKHSEIGYRILSSIDELKHLSNYVLYHHERWDGTGYPKGLKNDEIPLLSRIISIADSYEVMIHGRLYQSAKSPIEAQNELKACAGTQFDPGLVKLFLQIVGE